MPDVANTNEHDLLGVVECHQIMRVGQVNFKLERVRVFQAGSKDGYGFLEIRCTQDAEDLAEGIRQVAVNLERFVLGSEISGQAVVGIQFQIKPAFAVVGGCFEARGQDIGEVPGVCGWLVGF